MASDVYQQCIDSEKHKFSELLSKYSSIINTNDILKDLVDQVTLSAANAKVDAGFDGAMTDCGARERVKRLIYFLDGYRFGKSGLADDSVYSEFFKKVEREKDESYIEYLKLKKKFEG